MKRDKIAGMGLHPTGAGARLARTALAAACAASGLARATSGADPEPTVAWHALRNGGFEERGGDTSPRAIPWWRSTRGADQLESAAGGGSSLRTGPGEDAEQPFAAYAPLVDQLAIRGRVRGAGVVSIVDGGGAIARFPVRSTGADAQSFTITAADLARELGHAPVPRFTLRLAGEGQEVARWDDLDAVVVLPCPTEADLRAEVVRQLDAIFTTWAERALDVAGPRKTAFVSRAFDVVTGAELYAAETAAPVFALQENLLDAVVAHDEPRWRAFLERHVEDLLTLALHPDTGLPCEWNPVTDARIDDKPVEIALAFGYLIDVAREGPEPFRERARAAAVKIGETVLAKGQMPDGEVAASYVPRTGAVNVNVNRLRRLDVSCQLGRLSALTGDDRYAKAARTALATLEYTHYWAGTWEKIDPAFDDDFGHYAARAATIARARPEDVFFRRFAVEGLRHLLPLWRDATRFGGNVAADQVRCWRVAADLVRVDPSLRAELEPVLFDAVHAHVQGEQYGNGAWGDVTIFQYGPRNVQVGDYTGTPQNLLNGLSAAYTADLGLRTDLTRALYTAVLRSSVQEYGRPYGFLLESTANPRGGNTAAGSLRVLLGLSTMLRGLSGKPEPR